MTRSDWYHLLLFLHIGSVMVGLGPTFAFSVISAMGRKEGEHRLFAGRIVRRLTTAMAIPLAVVLFASGLGMMWAREIGPFDHAWLVLGIVLFLGAFGYSVTVQRRVLDRIITLGQAGPPKGPSHPEIARLSEINAWGGRYLRSSALVILYLMIFRPSLWQ